MSKITFTDKVALREVDVETINKIRAADINEIKASVNALYDYTAWATYEDGQYTSGSPFTVTAGQTAALPNNADVIVNDQMPDGLVFYAGGEITPETEGDLYLVDVHLTAASSVNDGAFDIILNNGHEQRQTIGLRRNAAAYVHASRVFVMPADATTVSNGATLSIEALSGNITLWDIEYTITRIHKAR